MFGAYKFRDQVAQQDCGYLGAFLVVSAASSYFTGGAAVSTFQTIGGSNNFHKMIYRLYVPVWGQSAASAWSHGSTNLYVASINPTYISGVSSSLSSISSVASNWTLIDSTNFTVGLFSSVSSLSGKTYVLSLDLRPEKFSAQWTYVTPVVVTTIGNALSTYAALTCDAYLTDYQPASNFDQGTVLTAEPVAGGDYF